MRRLALGCGVIVAAALVTAGCQRSEDAREVEGNDLGNKYRLAEEPAGAKGVLQVKKDSKDGDAVVVVGRVGGSREPFVEGRAGFTIVDPSLKPCNERPDDDCETPWDYCCDPRELLARATVLVKFVDEKGKTLETDARELLGIKPVQTVVVQGRAKRDAEGNLTVLASGLYVRKP